MSVIAHLQEYRKRKSKARVFEALEQLYMEVLVRLENEREEVDPEEFEEFMVQVLGDHLSGESVDQLHENYRRFDARLRKCLQTKIKTLQRFEALQKSEFRRKR